MQRRDQLSQYESVDAMRLKTCSLFNNSIKVVNYGSIRWTHDLVLQVSCQMLLAVCFHIFRKEAIHLQEWLIQQKDILVVYIWIPIKKLLSMLPPNGIYL